MLLIYGDPSAWAHLDEAAQGAVSQEYGTFTQTIVDSKEVVTGDPLQGPETATTVQVKSGKRLTTDGPFTETNEATGRSSWLPRSPARSTSSRASRCARSWSCRADPCGRMTVEQVFRRESGQVL